jgi:hypothetical protein
MILMMVVGAGILPAWLVLRAEGLQGAQLVLNSVAFGPGVGLGIVSFQLFFWRAAGFGSPRLTTFLMLIAVLGGGLALRPARAQNVSQPVTKLDLGLPVTLVAYLALAVSAWSVFSAYQSMERAWPDGVWDAVAIYNVKARIFHDRYDDFPEVLKAYVHPNYPLLLPGLIAGQTFLRGSDHVPVLVPALTALVFVLALGILLFAVLRASVVSGLAAAGTAVLWATPGLWLYGLSQLADIPAAYYFLGSTAVLVSQLHGREGDRLPPLLGGFFMGCLAWTKNEGVVEVALLLLLFVAWHWRGARMLTRRVLSVTAALILAAMPGFTAIWVLKNLWAKESGLSIFFGPNWQARLWDADRWWIPIRQITRRVLALDTDNIHLWWYLLPLLLIGAVAAAAIRRRGSSAYVRFWLLASVATVASWIPIYVLTPYNQLWHITTSLDRLLLQIYPLILVGILLGFGVSDGAAAPVSNRPASTALSASGY